MTSTTPAEQRRVTEATAGQPAAQPMAAPVIPRQATRAPDHTPLSARLRRPYAINVGVCLFYVLVAAWLTYGLWPDPHTRVLALNDDDQVLYEWFLAYDARLLLGDFDLVTDRLNAPDGVNLLANTSVIAIGALLAPITLLFGVPVTFAVVATGNLAGTAIAWYFLFNRALRLRRSAAAVGAGLCGFAPAMVSQSNSHLHMTAQWLVPLMIWCVMRMARAADPATDHEGSWQRRLFTPAAGLAALVCIQLFIGEEVLFLAAVTLALFTIGYALARPAYARRIAPRFAAGVLCTALLSGAVLAYPLWVQFAGPQHVPNGPFSPAYFSADMASFVAFSPLSLAGSPANARLSTGPAEYNTFLGWPLLILAVALAIWLRRAALVRALILPAVLMAWLSLGPQIVINGRRTEYHGIYALLQGKEIIENALPMRFAIALVPLLATLLAVALDRAANAPRHRWLVWPAVAVALVPIAPTPLPTANREPVPAFITEGHWRECVEPGGVLVPVPLPTPTEPDTMRWAAAANGAFGIPEGFFIGPYAIKGQASMGTYSQPTAQLLKEVMRSGEVPPIGPAEREQARRDLAFWGASCVALGPAPHQDQLRATLDALLGPGRQVAGTWTWPV